MISFFAHLPGKSLDARFELSRIFLAGLSNNEVEYVIGLEIKAQD
jgi:hypothetical protein